MVVLLSVSDSNTLFRCTITQHHPSNQLLVVASYGGYEVLPRPQLLPRTLHRLRALCLPLFLCVHPRVKARQRHVMMLDGHKYTTASPPLRFATGTQSTSSLHCHGERDTGAHSCKRAFKRKYCCCRLFFYLCVAANEAAPVAGKP